MATIIPARRCLAPPRGASALDRFVRDGGGGRRACRAIAADTRGPALVRDLRISVTDRCNFRCVYCMPKEVYGARLPVPAARASC